MVQPHRSPERALSEEAIITVLSCLVDDAYAHLSPMPGSDESVKSLSD